MKATCLLIMLIATAGCATSPPQAAQVRAGNTTTFVTLPSIEPAVTEGPGMVPFDAGLSAEDAWRGKQANQVATLDRPAFKTLGQRLLVVSRGNGLDNMPFGVHPFGPWDTGNGPQTP